jgi:membrane protease YdiL (CAAX protease family)
VFFQLINALIIHGEIAVRPGFEPTGITWSVFGATFEEILFRGFLLNTMLKRMKVWQAVSIDAILFTLIHFPVWIYWGFDFVTLLSSGVQLLPVSVLFAFSFIKTKNILVPIALHILWNLLGVLFVV